MMVGPEIRPGMIEKINDRAWLLHFVSQPAPPHFIVGGTELSDVPIFMFLQKLPGKHGRDKAIKARIMEIESCAFRHND
jgi:hypothetical protein